MHRTVKPANARKHACMNGCSADDRHRYSLHSCWHFLQLFPYLGAKLQAVHA